MYRSRREAGVVDRPEALRAALLQVVLEAGEQFDVVDCVGADPAVVDLLDGQRVEVVPAEAALAPDDDQAGLLQDAEVLHDRAAVELGEVAAEVARRAGLRLEQVEDAPSATVSQRFEYKLLHLRP